MELSIFGDTEQWKNPALVQDLLVQRMLAGNLLVCLGSGISYFADLPDWDLLLLDVAKEKKPDFELEQNLDPYIQANRILTSCYGSSKLQRQEFYQTIHRRLYRDVNDAELSKKVDSDEGLRTLQMLATGSIRGGSRYVVTFNYDDLLENLLRHVGIVTQSTDNHQFLLSNADVSVFHPHGLLRLADKDRELERFVVISQSDASNSITKAWRQTISFLLSKHFPLFIGLGGKDIRLLDLLDDVQEQSYLANRTRAGFFGVRLASSSDTSNSDWEAKGIKCICFEDMPSEWPEFVGTICRKAASIREVDANLTD